MESSLGGDLWSINTQSALAGTSVPASLAGYYSTQSSCLKAMVEAKEFFQTSIKTAVQLK